MTRPYKALSTEQPLSTRPSWRRLAQTLVGAVLAASTLATQAAEWPDRPIRLIVPFPTGGATDVISRLIAESASKALNTSIIVDNRTGAGGTIGSAEVARSKADGYTLLFSTSSTHAIAPHLYKSLPYDAEKDFTPIAHLGDAASVLLVNPSVPAQTLPELIEYARAHPDELNYASSGNGTIVHLGTEAFLNQANIVMSHVPYRGTGQAINDMLGGSIHVLLDAIPTGMPYVNSGQLRALAVTGQQRSPLAPDLPTFQESGLPGYESVTWFGLYAPAGLPDDIRDKAYEAFTHAIQDPKVRSRLQTLGVDQPRSTSREEFVSLVREDSARWQGLIQLTGIQIQ
ncbi:MAG: Bug family tripartite tricarboxylate transporter substrate binding protein [Alcaligenes sp.]